MCLGLIAKSNSECCSRVRYPWSDPTQPINGVTQYDPTHRKFKNLDPARPNLTQRNKQQKLVSKAIGRAEPGWEPGRWIFSQVIWPGAPRCSAATDRGWYLVDPTLNTRRFPGVIWAWTPKNQSQISQFLTRPVKTGEGKGEKSQSNFRTIHNDPSTRA